MSKVDFVRHLGAWYEAQSGAARDAGVTLRFGQTEDDRAKPSAWVAAEQAERVADLTIWSTGEAEFVAGGPGRADVNEHHELESLERLDVLLERLLAFVTR